MLRTQVAIVGAGPAGLLLAQLLHRHGVDTVILEARSRAYVEARIRAGVLEQRTRDVLREAGLGQRMERTGLVHGGIYLRFDGRSHHIPISELTDGRTVTVYGQTEVVKDLIAARLRTGAPLLFECEDVSCTGSTSTRPWFASSATARARACLRDRRGVRRVPRRLSPDDPRRRAAGPGARVPVRLAWNPG